MAKRQKRKPVVETWPNRAAAAAELGVYLNQPTLTTKTMEGWLGDPSCPMPRGRGPIPKVSLLVWVFTLKKGAGRPSDPASSAVRDAQAAVWQAKAQKITGAMVSVEAARATIEEAADRFKHSLLEEIPDAVIELAATSQGADLRSEVRDRQAQALNRWVEESRIHRVPGAEKP